MFTGQRQQIVIHGSTFVHTNVPSMSEGFKILHENIAIGAFHDSGERFDPPKCHPNTRVAVLKEIMQWILAVGKLEDVLWLYGSAGAGKSAIAQTIAEMCDKLGLIVASFFFSRAYQSRNNDKRLISSIAYQLAISIPATRSYIESAVQIDPAIFDRSLETQVETLIIRPLENACADVNPTDAKRWPRLIIIDGLDECDGSSNQRSIICVLSKALRRLPVPFILLLASRPEPHIRNAFNILSECHPSRHIVLDESYKPDADIKEFLLSRFKEIKKNHHLASYIPESWPSEEIVYRLVRKSSGQFIYASTIMRYLDSPKHRPMKRLDAVMGLIPVVGDMPYKELDALYSHIFSCVEDFATTLKILEFIFFRYQYSRFTPRYAAILLRLDEEDVYLHLSELHSILYIPPPPNTSKLEIRPMHASLQDFLVDKLRSGKYYLDEEAFHTNLAQQCVHHLSTWPINPGLKGAYPSLEWYLASSFIHHCTRASVDCANLKNDLMQLCDLRPTFETMIPIIDDDFLSLFEWLYKADTVAKELSNHIQSLWDQYLTSTLSEHPFNGSNVDIAGLLFFPRIWKALWFSLISGISQVPDIFTSFHNNNYRDLLCQFFEDKNRAGKYHVDGIVFAHAALRCFQNMVNPNDDEIFNPYPFILGIERPDAKLFMYITEDMISQRDLLVSDYWRGLQSVTLLLSKAAPLADLYFYLRDHPLQNPVKAKVHCEHGFGSLRLAVKSYLEKCKHLCPKVLRRSASCPLYSPYVDRELNSDEMARTFNQRWPLARDTSTRTHNSFERAEALATMRKLPEMMALRSRHGNREGKRPKLPSI